MGILQIFTLLGALGMFLYGMNLMSSGLQKAAGDKLRSFLSAMTSNPAKGVLTGLGVTTVIQSSSATTVMVVSFVNAGLLTLAQAISVIMGANIGTTVTAWMVAFLGFKADISLLAVPMMLSMLVQALYNIVDSIFVAQISENALTAVSMAFPIQNLMIAVGTGTGVGINALLSRNLGAKDYKRVNKIAEKIDYSRVLGLNSTVITIKN